MASILLIASYVVDWVVLIIFAVLGIVLGNISPNKRPFNVDNPDISFPYKGYDTVTLPVAFVVSVIIPAVLIFIISILIKPKQYHDKSILKTNLWMLKLWEWHAGSLGLALSVVLAWFFTSGMKNLFGKPRPNLLNRCQPDMANIARYTVGNVTSASGTSVAGALVSAAICSNPDKSIIEEGFRSFPSGHSSVAASGLVYLSLFITAKLHAGAPFLPRTSTDEHTDYYEAMPSSLESQRNSRSPSETIALRRVSVSQRNLHILGDETTVSIRQTAAGAPVYLLVVALVPVGAAIYICASRWYDFQHHGFDIIAGFTIGTISSIIAFRHYQLPFSQGAGWAWGPRSEKKAFWAGIGGGGFSAADKFLHQSRVIHVSQNGTAQENNESYQLQPV